MRDESSKYLLTNLGSYPLYAGGLIDFRDRRMWKLFQKSSGLLKNSYFVHRYKK